MNEELRSAILRVLPFAAVLIVVYLRMRAKKIDPASIDLRKPKSNFRFFIWTFGFLVLVLLIEFVLYGFGVLEINAWHNQLYASIIRIAGAVILAPIAEELLFRGFILNLLTKRKINNHVAIFIQACLFVALHNFTYQNTFSSNIGILQGLLDASLFAYARYDTGSIYTPMVMHMTGNAVATLERFVFFC